jgi:uncharacterized protein YndB with AHSA1/START domain
MTGKLKVEAIGDREVVITRAFNAPRDLVFEAYTKPELVRRWLLGPGDWTMPVCEIDLRVGGRYRFVWRHADGRQMGMGGAYREIVPSERVVSSEVFDEDWTGGEAVTTLVLTEKGGRTTAVSTVLYSSRAARDAVLKTPMADGMEAGYVRLDEILATV